MTEIIVNNTNDSDSGSLRNAIASAQPGDTITFDPSLTNQTILLSHGQQIIDKNLTIDGFKAPKLTIKGSGNSRIFRVSNGANFTLKNLTITGGKVLGTDPNKLEDAGGGAILIAGNSPTTIENCIFEGNSAGMGGAIYSEWRSKLTAKSCIFRHNDGSLIANTERGGGAVSVHSESHSTFTDCQFYQNKGTLGAGINSVLSSLTVENCQFIENDASYGGTVGASETRGYGGAIFTDGAGPHGQGGEIIVRNSTFERNKGAGQGGATFLGGYEPDKVTVDKCLFKDNVLVKDGKGDSLGGGLRIFNAEYHLSNSTFTQNQAIGQGGGLWVGEKSPGTIINCTFVGNLVGVAEGSGVGGAILIATSEPTEIVNCTMVNNQAGSEAGGIRGNKNVRITNTIIASNIAKNPWGNKQNTSDSRGFVKQPGDYFTDGGGNIEWPLNTNTFNNGKATATSHEADPKLGPLEDNGGGILTCALLAGSPAINAGVTDKLVPATDARGKSRVGKPDVGAFEVVNA